LLQRSKALGDCESVRLDSSTAPAINPARALIERALSFVRRDGRDGLGGGSAGSALMRI